MNEQKLLDYMRTKNIDAFFVSKSENVRFISGYTGADSAIYLPGWGGVRIEDQLLVTEDGYENMVNFTHDLIEL